MRRLSILFFVAAALAALPARAGERPPIDLAVFDEAMQLFAKIGCKTSPQRGPLRRAEVDITALADENGVIKISYVGNGMCRWHPPGTNAPRVRYPETGVVPVPEGDSRPVWVIAFDRGAQKIVSEGNRCDDDIRPEGFGRFKGLNFRLQATVGKDGVLRANWLTDVGCAWHPLAPSG